MKSGILLCALAAGFALASYIPSPSPGGAAGGDLSGTYPNPTVAQVNGGVLPLSAAAVATNVSRQPVAASTVGVGTKVVLANNFPPGSFLACGNIGITASAGTFFLPVTGACIKASAESEVAFTVNAQTNITNLSVSLVPAPGSGNSVAVTLRLNNVSQTLTCTISNAATSCVDNTHTITAPSSETIDWQMVVTGTPTSGNIEVMAKAGTT